MGKIFTLIVIAQRAGGIAETGLARRATPSGPARRRRPAQPLFARIAIESHATHCRRPCRQTSLTAGSRAANAREATAATHAPGRPLRVRGGKRPRQDQLPALRRGLRRRGGASGAAVGPVPPCRCAAVQLRRADTVPLCRSFSPFLPPSPLLLPLPLPIPLPLPLLFLFLFRSIHNRCSRTIQYGR